MRSMSIFGSGLRAFAIAAAIGVTTSVVAAPVFLGVNNSNLVRIDVGAQTVSTVGSLGVNDMQDCEFNTADELYGVRQGNDPGFPPAPHNRAYRINPMDGATVARGDFGFSTPRSLAYRSTNSQFYTVSGLNGQLSTVDLVSGALTSVSGVSHGLPGSFKIDALAFAPDGTLYGMWDGGNEFLGTRDFRLVRFDLNTGIATQIGAVGANRSPLSLRFDPTSGIAYTVDSLNGDVLSVNLTTGAGSVVYAGAAPGVTGIAFVPEPASVFMLLIGGVLIRRR